MLNNKACFHGIEDKEVVEGSSSEFFYASLCIIEARCSFNPYRLPIGEFLEDFVSWL